MIRSAFLACLFLCAANAPAQIVTTGGTMSGASISGPMDQIDFLAGYLSLTSAQVDQAKPLFNAERDAMNKLFGSMQQAQEALTAAEKSNQPDTEIDRLAGNLGAVHGQLAAIHSKTFMRFRVILTQDQKDKLDKMSSPAGGMGFSVSGGVGRPQ